MASIWEKGISIMDGNLNSGRSYLIAAVWSGRTTNLLRSFEWVVWKKCRFRPSWLYSRTTWFPSASFQQLLVRVIINICSPLEKWQRKFIKNVGCVVVDYIPSLVQLDHIKGYYFLWVNFATAVVEGYHNIVL